MGVTLARAMKIGAALPDIELVTTWGAPGLKLRGALLACQAINKSAEPNTLMVRVPEDQRDVLLEEEPSTYYLTDHYADYSCILVRLARIEPDALRDLLEGAWRFVDAKAKRPRRKPTGRS